MKLLKLASQTKFGDMTKESQYVEIDRPEVGMDGVNLLDNMQFYPIFIKSKKWTLQVIMHYFDIGIVIS